MSYASSKTLYILNYQSVDLVLTADGIKVDNRPMNQQRPGSMANTDPDTEPENDPENDPEPKAPQVNPNTAQGLSRVD